MTNEEIKLLELLKINYEKMGSLYLACKHTLVDTNSLYLLNEIIFKRVLKELEGQIPEIWPIDTIVGMMPDSCPIILPFVTLAKYRGWNLKPIFFEYSPEHGLSWNYGKIRQKDNVIILNIILNGNLNVKCIEKLWKYKTYIVKIISLIDPLDGSREKILHMGFQPKCIYTIKDFEEDK